ncbi:DUF1656 domain-containing protein [Methylobacillus arboreus]|uniref:DUF1656 domain-containing protein n=1 Tax=Methylobacillus arboreus TaxID=755170 RepID=UPI001E39FC6F|nr:DUF1656 domain-containing protein [Methylobacillus arboreus]MCB5190795.1 DUF1656 domain-containing protein [Methylobacillus arboreus]
MPRELALLDALVPALILAFAGGLALSWLLDQVFTISGLYRHIWYRALFRLGLFICLVCSLGLMIY